MGRSNASRSCERSERGIAMVALLVMVIMLSDHGGRYDEVHSNSVIRTKEAALKTDLFQMREALDQYYADKGKYPASLEALVGDHYLRSIPVDPFTQSADTWQTVFAEPDAGNLSAELGISDVKSGSDAASLNHNTSYSDW